MAEVYADLILSGIKNIDEVPGHLLEKVKMILSTKENDTLY